jgi:peptidyl-tRNA hydrolase, PTH1 family
VPADLLVVGLGNPGEEFAKTRHNVGAEVVELLARRHGGKLKKSRRDRALVTDVRIGACRVALAIPQTYMNDSGRAVQPLAKHYDVEPSAIIVVHDELDLPPAALKLKVGGGLAGHNGLRSIKQHLHSDEFVRVRIGVGKPPSKERGADHVLSRVSKREREQMAVTIEEAADAVEAIVTDGIDPAMNRYNTRG